MLIVVDWTSMGHSKWMDRQSEKMTAHGAGLVAVEPPAADAVAAVHEGKSSDAKAARERPTA